MHLLAKEKVSSPVWIMNVGKVVASLHSKSGEAIEVFEARVERVLPFLQ